MSLKRCSSEPPESLDINEKTGLRRGFPIKIAGRALGSQESLTGRAPERGLFGQRLGLRQISDAPFSSKKDSVGERRRSLRGSTPIRNPFLDQSAPFANSGNLNRRSSIGGVMSKGSPTFAEKMFESQINNRDSSDTFDEKNTQSRLKVENCLLSDKSFLEGNKNPAGNRQFSAHSVNDRHFPPQNDLDHEIKKMSERIAAFENESNFSDLKDVKEYDTELQEMRVDLEELNLEKKSIETSNSLDDVITKMKNSLAAIKDGVNQKTLIDLNREVTPLDLPPLREMTPLDLPALSPLPPMMIRRRKVTKKEPVKKVNVVIDPCTSSVDTNVIESIVDNSGKHETSWNIVNRDIDPHSDGQGQFNNEEVESTSSRCSITVQLAKHLDNCNNDTKHGEIISYTSPYDNVEIKENEGLSIESEVDVSTICDIIDAGKIDTCKDTSTSNDITEEKEVNNDTESHSSESTYLFLSDDSSVCSTPTVLEMSNKASGYESDSSVYPDTDCEDIYGPFKINVGDICEISDMESEEEEWKESSPNTKLKDMDTAKIEIVVGVSNSSQVIIKPQEDGERPTKERTRRPSGKRKSISNDKKPIPGGDNQIGKTRYCWRCHQPGHDSWECEEDVPPDEWCARCLETDHWEDECWVLSASVLCPICSVPGHLPAIHQATDYRQRKLVIDTFGWLSFKEWFQDLNFRSWWNCSGFTGVPLYKIMMRNNSKDLDLGFEEN